MVVQVLLQIGKRPFYLVVRVGHSLAVLSLVCEEIRHVEFQAVHGGSQPLMGVVRTAVPIDRTPVDGFLPRLFPGIEC